MMKKVMLLATLFALVLSGCIKVEDEEDTNQSPVVETPEAKPSSVTIQANQDDFSITWNKNTEGYGQLEITDNPSVPSPITSAVNQKKVILDCKYQSPDILNSEGEIQKKYTCNLENSGVIGTFPLLFPADTSMEIIERNGKSVSNDYEVLSDFYIHSSHGTSPELESSVTIQANQDDFSITWNKNTEGYGQLEITDNPSVPMYPMAYSDSIGEIQINCKAQDYNESEQQINKKYECSTSPGDTVGVYNIEFELDKIYQIVQRNSKKDAQAVKLGIIGFRSK
jgi:hypothetical protein